MIARLEGVLLEKEANRVLLDVHGVGYEISIPYSTYYELGGVGETSSLKIYTHVKEDALSLFGFLTQREKRLFSLLIQISGIGPKLAVTVLSGLAVDDFLKAVDNRDIGRLTRIPGVGKKTAERMVLELQDKLEGMGQTKSETDSVAVVSRVQTDVVSALINLGYTRSTSEEAVSGALEDGVARVDDFEQLLRAALREVST